MEMFQAQADYIDLKSFLFLQDNYHQLLNQVTHVLNHHLFEHT